MGNSREIMVKEFVYDLNWINRQSQDFAARVAFLVVAKKYTTLTNLNQIPFFARTVDSMYVTALIIAGIIYDKRKDVLSLPFLLKKITQSQSLGQVVGLSRDEIRRGVSDINKRIIDNNILISRILSTRHKLFAHSERIWSRRLDSSRNIINAPPTQRRKAIFQWIKNRRAIMVREKDLEELMVLNISILQSIKNFLRMPDRIFSSCSNDVEWNIYYESCIKDAKKYFEVITQHGWVPRKDDALTQALKESV